MLQTYFQHIPFVKAVLDYEVPEAYVKLSDGELSQLMQSDASLRRKILSCQLIASLKSLFVAMIGSDRKFADPEQVLSKLVDDFGNPVAIGDQKDLGEFSMIFFERLQDGFKEGSLSKEAVQNPKAMSQSTVSMPPPVRETPTKDDLFPSPESLFNTETRPKEEPKMEEELSLRFSQSSVREGESPSRRSALAGRGSLLRRSSLALGEPSLVMDLLLGRLESVITLSEGAEAGQKGVQYQEEVFNILFLDSKHKELYTSLEKCLSTSIDDYRNEQGKTISAVKNTWIVNAPPLLFFQLNRLEYDCGSKSLRKRQDKFEFPRHFYLDSFLAHNRAQALQVRQDVAHLRAHRQRLREALEELDNFNQSGVSLPHLLEATGRFIEQFSQRTPACPSQPPAQQGHSLLVEVLSLPSDSVGVARKLAEILSLVEAKRQHLLKEVQKIDQQIEAAYALIRTKPYELLSVMIHEGSAESGHYYTYIHDLSKETWWRFNDVHVAEADELAVIADAQGGFGWRSAYALIYARREVVCPAGFGEVKGLKTSNEPQYLQDLYGKMLQAKELALLQRSNQSFKKEIEDFVMAAEISRILDAYSHRFELCNEVYRRVKEAKASKSANERTAIELVNLPLYAKQLNERDYRSILLEKCLQEFGPSQPSSAFLARLRQRLEVLNEFKRPERVSSSMALAEKFLMEVRLVRMMASLYDSVRLDEYHVALRLIEELFLSAEEGPCERTVRTFTKSLIMLLLMEAEKCGHPETVYTKTGLAIHLLNTLGKSLEANVRSSAMFWLMELEIPHPVIKPLLAAFQHLKPMPGLEDMKAAIAAVVGAAIQKLEEMLALDVEDALWNLDRTDGVWAKEAKANLERLRERLAPANKLFLAMKRSDVPLNQEERKLVLAG